MDFAEKVRGLLAMRRLSQARLARGLGTTQQTVNRWLDKNKPPKSDYLLKLARALEVSVEFLIDETMDELPDPSLAAKRAMVMDAIHRLGYDEVLNRLLEVKDGVKVTGGPKLDGEAEQKGVG